MRLRCALLLFILEVDMLENTFKTGLVKELKSRFGAPVKVKSSGGKNKIEIEFKDEEDLQRIYGIIRNQM